MLVFGGMDSRGKRAAEETQPTKRLVGLAVDHEAEIDIEIGEGDQVVSVKLGCEVPGNYGGVECFDTEVALSREPSAG